MVDREPPRRKKGRIIAAATAIGLSLTACGNYGRNPAPTEAPTAAAATSTAGRPETTAPTTTSTEAGSRTIDCTQQDGIIVFDVSNVHGDLHVIGGPNRGALITSQPGGSTDYSTDEFQGTTNPTRDEKTTGMVVAEETPKLDVKAGSDVADVTCAPLDDESGARFGPLQNAAIGYVNKSLGNPEVDTVDAQTVDVEGKKSTNPDKFRPYRKGEDLTQGN